MDTNPDIKPALVLAVLKRTPPLICESLLKEPSFREEYHLMEDPVVTIDNYNTSIQRSNLFSAIREIHSDALAKEVTGLDDRKWTLNIAEGGEELSTLSLSHEKQHFPLLNYVILSPNKNARLRFLDTITSRRNLPSDTANRWRSILSERALEDNEVDKFYNDIDETPFQLARSIRNEILKGSSNKSSLVPPSRRYFERLVGAYDGSTSIRNYASGEGKKILNQLSIWNPYDGFLFSLFLSSHSCITDEINVDQLSDEDIVRAFDFLDKRGDRISQLGAIEIGFRILPSKPDIEQILVRLIEKIRDDVADEKTSGFNLLSALFILVDSELSRLRLFPEAPPFYRRLAALSQASLIHRELVNSGIDIGKFSKWAYDNSGSQFYLQSLTDMRLEPRWDPNFAIPKRLQFEFFGRIINASTYYKQNIANSQILDLVLGDHTGSLLSLSHSFIPYFPGPLEGTEEIQNVLPPEMEKQIEAQFNTGNIEPSSFFLLVNSVIIFRATTDKTELAARTLKLAKYRFSNIESKSQLIDILDGLAIVAAISRSISLANELQILVRVYRRDAKYALSVREIIRICLVAAASRMDLHDWIDFVGGWITELAFSDLKNEEGKELHSCLNLLCQIVPELWSSCSRADAALMAFNEK